MRRLLVMALVATSLVAACGADAGGSRQSSNPDAPLQVVTTTTVLTDFAAVIAHGAAIDACNRFSLWLRIILGLF